MLLNGHKAPTVHRPLLAEEAIREIHLAQDLDPLSLTLSAEIAWHLYMARDYDRAIEQALRTLELEPQNSTAQGVVVRNNSIQAATAKLSRGRDV